MAEISVEFKNKLNGYDKAQVNEFVKDTEAKLQQRAQELSEAKQQVADLEAKLEKLVGEPTADESGKIASLEEKVELYDKLMKKMDGDYNNLLAPAVAKAKAIEAEAEKEYAIRIDQARYSAEGIYAEAADRIAGVVDNNMDRMYGLLDEFIYSKTLPGRFNAFVKTCKAISEKIAASVNSAAQVAGKAKNIAKDKCASMKEAVVQKYTSAKEAVLTKIDNYQTKDEVAADADVVADAE